MIVKILDCITVNNSFKYSLCYANLRLLWPGRQPVILFCTVTVSSFIDFHISHWPYWTDAVEIHLPWMVTVFKLTALLCQWIEDVLFMMILQPISRTTGPTLGLFILIWMHFLADSKYGHNIYQFWKFYLFNFFYFNETSSALHTYGEN